MRELKIRLSDEQCDALATEAKRNGLSYFDHCRLKLLAGLDQPLSAAPARLEKAEKLMEANAREAERVPPRIIPDEDDRISRIEDAVARLTDYILQGQQPPEPMARAQTTDGPIDVDSMISAQLADAEARGLTEHVPDEVEEVMRVSGMRPLARRAPKFSPSNVPRHLNQLG